MAKEAELARRAAAGDAAAFAALVRIHEAPVRRFLSRLAGPGESDDIAQEAFIKAWRTRAAWRGDGSYGGWLMRIAWTSFLSSKRAHSRRQARDHLAWEGAETEAEATPRPDERIDLERALAALGTRERAAAELCFSQGYSHAEASGILGLPLGTLKSLVARARAELVKVLEDRDG